MEDEQILTLFKEEKTKEQAFRALMEKYQHTIYYTVRHYVFLHEDADDITQNVFIKVWRYLENFRGESSLKTWITRISINESLTFLEKKKKTLNLSDDQYTDHLLNVAAEERHFSADNIEQLLQKAIIKLPEKQRLVFTLRYYEEMPYEEMSKALGTSVGALKASYHFAMQKVEADLKEAVK